MIVQQNIKLEQAKEVERLVLNDGYSFDEALQLVNKKATKNPDQSILSSKTKNIHKNSTSLYHMEGGNQAAN